jgi:hypothetical protein
MTDVDGGILTDEDEYDVNYKDTTSQRTLQRTILIQPSSS